MPTLLIVGPKGTFLTIVKPFISDADALYASPRRNLTRHFLRITLHSIGVINAETSNGGVKCKERSLGT